MYNEKQKLSFMNDYTERESTKKFVGSLFDALERYEELYNKDICFMDLDELQPAVDSVIGLRVTTKWSKVATIREYIKWCGRKGIPNVSDAIKHINILGIDKIKGSMVSSPMDLHKCLNNTFDNEEEQTAQSVFHAYFWMAFMGVPIDYTVCIEKEHIDFESMILRYNGDEWPMYRESLRAFKNVVLLTKFKFDNGYYKEPIYRNRVPGTTILRGVRSTPPLKFLRSNASAIFTKSIESGRTHKRLSYERVKRSGIFYRMHEAEICGEPVDFFELANAAMADKEYALDKGRTKKNLIEREARAMMEEYQSWKLAFY